MMDFGLFHTWNAMYAGGKVPWDPAYRGGKLLEEEAYARNLEEVNAVEEMGWDYIWLGGGHFSKQASMDPQPLMLSAADRRPHQQDQDRDVRPPPGVEATRGDGLRTSTAP